MVLRIVFTFLVGYLLGSQNGAIYVSRMMHDDVRSHGSGNAGFTNFVRNYGVRKALLVFVIDALKAVLGCLLGGLMFPGNVVAGRTLGGLGVILGHDFPALQGFRGGKGILSGCFIAFMVDWRIGAVTAGVFFAAYLLTHYVSLGSILSAITFGVCYVILYHNNIPVMLCGVFMSLLTVFQHRSNISRLLKGQERKTNLLSKGTKQ